LEDVGLGQETVSYILGMFLIYVWEYFPSLFAVQGVEKSSP